MTSIFDTEAVETPTSIFATEKRPESMRLDGDKHMAADMYAMASSEPDYDTAFLDSMESIQASQSHVKDAQAKSARIQRLSQETQNLVDEGDTDYTDLANSIAAVDRGFQEADATAAKKEQVQKYREFRDSEPAWADVAIYNKDFLDQRQERMEKEAIVRAHLAEAAYKELEEDSFFGDAVDIALDTVSFGANQAYSYFATAGNANPGVGMKAVAKGIMELDSDEIPAALDTYIAHAKQNSGFFNTDDERAMLNVEQSFNRGASTGSMNDQMFISTIMDAVPIPLADAAVKTVAKQVMRLGGAKRVAADAAKILGKLTPNKASTVISHAEATELSMPLKVMEGNSVDSVSTQIQKDLQDNQDALEAVKSLALPDRTTPEQRSDMMALQLDRFQSTIGNEHLVLGAPRHSSERGGYIFDMIQGRKDGKPYASQSAATSARNKAKNGGEVFQADEGGWYIKHTQSILEDANKSSGFKGVKPVGSFRKWLQAPKAFIDENIGKHGTAAGQVEARTAGVVKKIYNDNIRKLPSADFRKVFEVADEGMKKETWFSADELADNYLRRHGEVITEAQTKAYMTARQISDFGYFLDNRAAYQQAISKGMETITLPGIMKETFNGKIIENPSKSTSLLGARAYNAVTGQHVKVDADLLEEIAKKKHIVVKPEDAGFTLDVLDEGASYIIGTAKQVKNRGLDTKQIGYVAGGRVSYEDKFFIGQTRGGKFEDGTRYSMRPKTFRSAKTQLEAERYVTMHNAALPHLDRWLNYGNKSQKKINKTRKEVSDQIMTITGRSLDDYASFVKKEGWDTGVPLHSRGDRQAPPVDADTAEAVRMFDPESLSSGFGVRKGGRTSARTEHRLKNVNDDEAVQLDFISSLNKSMDSSIKSGSYTDFKIASVNNFHKEYAKYFENPDRYNPNEIAMGKAPIAQWVEPEIKSSIEAHSRYIQGILRQPTAWDATVQNTMQKMANFVEGNTHGTKGQKAGRQASILISDIGDPIGRIRGLNFDLNLGMFNPAQLFMQANSVLTAMTLSPKHGVGAALDLPLLRYALILGDKATIGRLAKEGGDAALQANADQFKRLGFNDFGANLAMMDAQSTLGATSNRFMSNVDRVREAGRFFFQEGERYGRLTAYGIARRKFIDIDHKELKIDANPYGRDADLWIREETDRLLLSPNSDNNQLLTKGITAIPTQFWSYMGKMADAVLTGSGGRYTAAERRRLIGGQALFYGAAGVPFADWALNEAQTASGEVIDPTVNKMLHNGLIDTMLFAASGGDIDTDFSGSSGLGGWSGQMVDNIFENPVAALALGAVGSKLSSTTSLIDARINNLQLINNPSLEDFSEVVLAGMGGLFSGFDKVSRGIAAFNAGVLLDKKGRVQGDVSGAEAMLSIFGVQPQIASDAYAIFAQKKENREDTKNYVNQYEYLLRRFEASESESARLVIQQQINNLALIHQATGYDQQIAFDVMKRLSNSSLQQSAADSQAKEYQQGRAVNPNLMSLDQRNKYIEMDK